MATLPTSGVLGGASITNSDFQTQIENLRDKLSQQPGTDTPAALTISGGSVTPATRDTGGVIVVDTEAAAASDDLTTIATTNVEDGAFLYVFGANASRVVTVKDSSGGTGQIVTTDSADFVLDALEKWILLRLDGTEWKEIARGFGTDNESRQGYHGIVPVLGNVLAPHQNLVIQQASVSTVTITADKVVLSNANGFQKLYTSVNETPNITSGVGAGGIDAGTEASNTWYHIYLIGTAAGTIDAIFSTNASAPTLPSGYTFYGYVGAVYNSGSDFIDFHQRGGRVVTATDTALSYQTIGTTVQTVTCLIPNTATSVICVMRIDHSAGNSGDAFMHVSPENNGTSSLGRVLVGRDTNSAGQAEFYSTERVHIITAQTVYVWGGGATNNGALFTIGWEF